MFKIENIRGKTEQAARRRMVADQKTAINSAKATSEFFHGVFEVKNTETGEIAGYFVGGRRYKHVDSAYLAAR
jgi:hypothetical protein